MKSTAENSLLDLISEENENQLKEIKGMVSVDYEAIAEHCKRTDLPEEMKLREAVLMAESCVGSVNYSKFSKIAGFSVGKIKDVVAEMSVEIEELSQQNRDKIAKSLGIAAITSSFDPKAPVEKLKFTYKQVLGQELEEEEGTRVSINGNVMIINSDSRKQVANYIQKGPLNQGKKKALPENVNPTPEFLDIHVDNTEKLVAKKLKEMENIIIDVKE